MTIQEILPLLACPKCHSDLTLLGNAPFEGLFCQQCGLVYPIEDTIPILLINEAIPWEDWQKGVRKKSH
ncbi:MAG: Trm112 family protein [Desulfovibrio sp.]|nr:Trm112 family protein [Desulfovibrio sp.]